MKHSSVKTSHSLIKGICPSCFKKDFFPCCISTAIACFPQSYQWINGYLGDSRNDAESFLVNLAIDPIIGNHSWLDVISGWSSWWWLSFLHQSLRPKATLPVRVQVDAMKDLFPIIREINIIKRPHFRASWQESISRLDVGVSTFVGFLIGFDHFSIDQFIIDQRHFFPWSTSSSSPRDQRHDLHQLKAMRTKGGEEHGQWDEERFSTEKTWGHQWLTTDAV